MPPLLSFSDLGGNVSTLYARHCGEVGSLLATTRSETWAQQSIFYGKSRSMLVRWRYIACSAQSVLGQVQCRKASLIY